MSKSGHVDYERHGDIARIWLNDPPTLNALTAAMVEDMSAALDEAEASARALVLSGRGTAFCSGANLSPAEIDLDKPLDAGLLLETHVNPLMLRFRDLSIPWITSVPGVAAGVGCALALAGDLVVASEKAAFLQAFRRVGLVPDGGSAFLLARAAGRVRAMEMMLLGEKVDAQTALAWGLVNRVVPVADLEATTVDIATRLAHGPTRALALTRRSTWAAMESGWEASLATERAFQAEAGRTSDFAEGVQAFREKRPARFTGR